MYSAATYPSALNSSFSSNRYTPGSRFRPSGYPTPDYTSPSTRFSQALAATKSPGYTFHSVNPSSRPFIRSVSVSPNRHSSYFKDSSLMAAPMRNYIRGRLDETEFNTRNRLRSPSVMNERTRDELIDSIVHTRTREHRAMPGFRSASNWEERRSLNIDCDKVYPGIYLANGDTVKNMDYLKSVGVTHVLNTAERHVQVNPSKYPLHNISYFGFHVDDHPSSNISRFFNRTSDFIDEAVSRGGTVAVNCVMGWSRSATIVAAYLVTKKGMSSNEALEQIRMHRPIRPNPGFLQQLADYENLMRKRLVWN